MNVSNSSSTSIVAGGVDFSGVYHAKIKWKLSGLSRENMPAINYVDYFIISCKRQGVESVLGCAHGNVQGKSAFAYIDLQKRRFCRKNRVLCNSYFLNGMKGDKIPCGLLRQARI